MSEITNQKSKIVNWRVWWDEEKQNSYAYIDGASVYQKAPDSKCQLDNVFGFGILRTLTPPVHGL